MSLNVPLITNSDKLIIIDNYNEYVPLLSTLNSAINLLAKVIFKIFLIADERMIKDIKGNKFSKHLYDKSIYRCLFLCIPIIGNIYFYIYDTVTRKVEVENPIRF